MSYTSFAFFCFLAVTLIAYFAFPVKKYQWTVLLAASYFFYACASLKGFCFILFTTLTTWGTGVWLDKIEAEAKATVKAKKAEWSREEKKKYKKQIDKKKRSILAVMLVANFGILGFLKYYNFVGGSINGLFSSAGIDMSLPVLRLILPLGISFYTFQSMGYIIDVYRGTVQAEKNVMKFALFVSFFPQIIQGPIAFYSDLAHQLYEPHSYDFTRMKYGMELMLWGYFKKLVIADRAVGAINIVIDDYTSFSGGMILFAILLYALQLYADFSAGIDISRGIAQIMGIDMAENFKRPYFARTITEYWHRWHITLGNWMKSYVFYPVAMSKAFTNMSKSIKASRFGKTPVGAHLAKVLPASIASFIVFVLVGIWHGANWKYVGFGVWNGGVIMISTLLEPFLLKTNERLHINTESLWFRCFQMARTFVIVLIGYAFDLGKDFSSSIDMMVRTVMDFRLQDTWIQKSELEWNQPVFILLGVCTVLLFIVSLIQERNPQKTIRKMLDEKPFVVRWIVLFVSVMAIIIFGVYGPGYSAAEFVYIQF